MKKRLFFPLMLLTLYNAVVNAQQPANESQPSQKLTPRLSLSILAGPAFPEGQFGNTEKQNPVSGPVHTGSIIEYSATWHLNRSWGIALLAGSQKHSAGIDRNVLPFGGTADPSPEWLAMYQEQHWKMTRILTGGVYTLPLNRSQCVALLLRALAGIQQTKTGEFSYVVPTGQGGYASTTQPGQTLAWTFSYQADAGLQWTVYRRLSLLAFGGYTGSRPHYDLPVAGVFAPASSGGAGGIQRLYFPTGSLLLRGGVGFSL